MGMNYRLYLITDSGLAGGYQNVPGIVAEAIAGGVTVVQVRDKELDDATFTELARAVDDVARPNGVPVIVNDRVDVAATLGLGVHIGQDDMPLDEVRVAVGARATVGLSISNEAELDALEGSRFRPDVIGIGPLMETPTKPDAAPPVGFAGTRRLAARAEEMGIATVSIGGINYRNIDMARATGVDGVCVVSAIMSATDPRAAARQLSEGC